MSRARNTDTDDRQHRERKRHERERLNAGITWLEEPVVFGVHGRCRVVGVCNDAPDATKEMYGIKVPPPLASPASLQSLADRSQRRRSHARAMARA